MNRFFITGYCDKERLPVINEIKEIINIHGFIVDFKMFSDISMNIAIETEERKIRGLFCDLKNVLILDEFRNPSSNSSNESLVLLNVTFNKGTGDVRRHVPSVPG